MFRPETPPLPELEGYRLSAFRQGRCNLAERTLRHTVYHFAPQFGLLGLFLPQAARLPTEADLREAWLAQGAPAVRRPASEGETLLFGRVVPLRGEPFAGYDDQWWDEASGTLICACRRELRPERLRQAAETVAAERLLAHANTLLQQWQPRLPKQPPALVVKPLSRRILGQCTRTGEIRLSPSLIQWPETILAETLAHELIHLRHFNHAPAFWRDLSALLPDWLERSLVHYLVP